VQSHVPLECCVSEYWSLIRKFESRAGKGAVCLLCKVWMLQIYAAVNSCSDVSP